MLKVLLPKNIKNISSFIGHRFCKRFVCLNEMFKIKLYLTASYRRWLLIWHLQSLVAQVRDVDNMNFLLPWMAFEKTATLNTVDLLTSPSV